MRNIKCKHILLLLISAVTVFVSAAFPVKETVTTAESSPLQWHYTFEGKNWSNAPSSPVIAGDYVIVFSGTKIYKLSLNTGEKVASAETGYSLGYGVISPTVDISQRYIYMAFSEGVVACYNFSDLSVKWVYHDEIGGQCNSPLISKNNVLYTGFWKGETKTANYVAINAVTGSLKWSFSHIGGFYWAGGIVVGKNIIIGSDDGVGADNGNAEGVISTGKVYSLSCSDGSVNDVFEVVGDQRCQITYLTGRKELLFTSKGGYLYSVLLRSDGKFERRGTLKLIGGQSTSQPMVYNGRIYVCSGDGINKSGTVEIIDLGTFERIYHIDSDYYPQCGVGLVAQGESVDIYYNYNGYPGGIKKLTDSAEITENSPSDYYVPIAELQQYCIGHLSISGNKLVYKNDSSTVFCLNITEASGSLETAESGFSVVNSCTYSALITLIRADKDTLETSSLYRMLLSSEFEYGKDSDYFAALDMLYKEVQERDKILEKLSEDIKVNCADITKVGLSDRKTIRNISDNYNALSDLNKERVTGYDDLQRALNKVNTLHLAVIISFVSGAAAIGLAVYIVIRIKKRKKIKEALSMSESDE